MIHFILCIYCIIFVETGLKFTASAMVSFNKFMTPIATTIAVGGADLQDILISLQNIPLYEMSNAYDLSFPFRESYMIMIMIVISK